MAEFAAAVGLPTETGKAYLGEALELRHRLPRTWARVGPVTCRRGGPAGSPARRSRSSPAAAGFVDDQVAAFAHRIRPSGVDRLVEEAIVRFMPAEARRRREAAADGRHAHVHTDQVSFEGTVWVEAEVDLADALDLDTALSAGAARLADLGSAASLDVRRSEALGEMARHQLVAGPRHRTDDTRPARAGRWCCTCTSPRTRSRHPTPAEKLHLARVANTRSLRRRRPGPRLVRRPRHHGDGEAGGRPDRAPPRRPVPGPRPARRPGSRTGPDLCVPVVHPPRRGLRHGPRDPLLRGRPHGERQPRARSAGATTGSRPTTPAGATPSSNPAPTCGPHRTATSSCATTAAPPTSPATGPRTRPTSSDPAPHPAPALPGAGPPACPRSGSSRPAPPPPPSQRARESVWRGPAPAGRRRQGA